MATETVDSDIAIPERPGRTLRPDKANFYWSRG
jgi:hypothetical protein